MAYITPQDRSQLFFHRCLDDVVSRDNPVRLLDAFVDKVLGRMLDEKYAVGNSHTGRPAYSPRTLLKLYLYGYVMRIPSSRRLEVETKRNLEMRWLLQELEPDHKTIANFRSRHGEVIQEACRAFRQFLKEGQFLGQECIAVDGTRIKANANREVLTLERLERRIRVAEEQILKYLQFLDQADRADDDVERLDSELPEEGELYSERQRLLDEVAELHAKIAALEEQKRMLEESGASKISPADPEARVMKTRDGKVPAYNVQIAVDATHKMIAEAYVTQDETDFEQLVPMLDALEQNLDIVPEVVLADKGYSDLGDIKAIQENGHTLCYIPENDAPVKNRAIQFRYDEAQDVYICSAGRELVPIRKGIYDKRKRAFMDTYRGVACSTCPLLAACTTNKSRTRQISVFHGATWRAQYRRQLRTRKARIQMALRKTIVEHPFGTIKCWMGKIPLLLRGKAKAQVEICLWTTAYNLKRLFSVCSFDDIMRRIETYEVRAA